MSRFPRCRLCGVEHRLGGEHVFPDAPSRVTSEASEKGPINKAQRAKRAINAPINKTPINAINKEDVSHVAKPIHSAGKESGAGDRSTNGRKREDYNAYMRGYMARRRAAGRVSG